MGAIVIVGTGLAGYSLARELRKRDAGLSLTLISEDDGAFYSKPMLSNGLALGKDAAALATSNAGQMAATLDAQVLPRTTVTAIDPAGRTITAGGKSIGYRALVLAVGARPVRPPMAGDGATAVMSVNNLGDYARFRRAIEGVRRIAIIGPGLIGCEFANDLIANGYAVEVIGPDRWPISTLLPEQAGADLRAGLEAVGVRFHLGRVVPRVERAGDGLRLELDDGATVCADRVLSAIGLRPDTRLAAAAGLAVNRGIVVDRLLRSSDPAIFALGDCAEVDGRNLPFVMPLMFGARALARTLTGEETPVDYPAMPVVIKTPARPVAVQPPLVADGAWHETVGDDGVRARWITAEGSLQGFALTGAAAAERQRWVKRIGQPADAAGGG